MRAHRFPFVAAALLALAACSPTDLTSPAVVEEGPRLDTTPPAWLGSCAVVVRFSVPALGTVYGAPVGQPPGTLAFTENGVNVITEKFLTPGGTLYDAARIENAPAAIAFGDGQVARMRNINFRYRPPAGPYYSVIFEFMDLGGIENVSVNGQPIYVGDVGALPNPYFVWNTGVGSSPIAGGKEGVVRITGTTPIKEVLIGGQEFWVDNVCFQ